MSIHALPHRGYGLALAAALALHADPFLAPAPAAGPEKALQIVPLVSPLGERGGDPKFRGLFRKIVTARGAELDDSRTSYHIIKPIGVTDTFSPDTPAIYVVAELLQNAFADFRLVARFILEDPEGKPVGTVLHTDKALFENEDTGGYLVMKRPPGGFPVGKYRVEIHYGEQVNDISLLTLARFKVAGPTKPVPSPAP
jgi:hypothetical protein